MFGFLGFVKRMFSAKGSLPQALIDVITRDDILKPSALVTSAAEQVSAGGAPAADALAVLIDELLECRSDGLGYALAVAKRAASTQRLRASIEAVLASSPVCYGRPGRFRPQIVGDGRIGLTDGRWEYIQESAREALNAQRYGQPLMPAKAEEPNRTSQEESEIRDLAELEELERLHNQGSTGTRAESREQSMSREEWKA